MSTERLATIERELSPTSEVARTDASRPLLVVEDLSVEFTTPRNTVFAVRSVDLSISAGECLAVVGESGSGKSVTARSLVGLAGPNARVAARSMTFEGRDLAALSENQWRKLRGGRIGFVLQDALTSLDPLRRVGAEVAEPLEVHGLAKRRELPALVDALLSDVGIPDPHLRARQYPHELSGGLRQRALIASAIAAGPSLVIADEPTTALDVTVQAQVLDLLATKKDNGVAVLLISHDLTVVARLADRIAVMYGGFVVEEGSAEQILRAPRHPYTVDLLAAAPSFDSTASRSFITPASVLAVFPASHGCPYASRCVLADDRCRVELPEVTNVGRSHLTRCWHPESVSRPRDSAIPACDFATGSPSVESSAGESSAGESSTARPVTVQALNLSKRFRSPDGSWRQAVDNVSFTLHAGEALGVVGESGSGKTTTAQIVLGMLAPDTGSVLVDGAPWSALKERERRSRREKIQIVYQDPLSSFDPRFTVERIVGEALGRAGRRGAVANRPRIVELLGDVGLDETFLYRRSNTLSGGQRQRVAIARALAPRPEVIICDEPVSALDVSVQAQILDLFSDLRSELGVALLFISHDLGVIHQVCDRIVVMKDGSIVETGEVKAVFAAPQHPYTRALLSALPTMPGGQGAVPNEGVS